MEYSWMPNCSNSCGLYNNTECKNLDIACMCRDDNYITTSLCCLDEKCGAFALPYARTYIKSYCEEFKVTPPNMNNPTCTRVSSTPSATATSTIETSSATSTSNSSDDFTTGKSEMGPNIGLIAGVAAGVGVLLLALVGAAIFFFCRRKRETEKKRDAAEKVYAAKEDLHSSSAVGSSTLEAVQMSELAPVHASPYGYNYTGSQVWEQQRPGSSPYNISRENMQPVSPYSPLHNGGFGAELGTDGARPHGSELAGRPMLPPRPELQGMSFVTRNPYPSELPPSEPTYQR